ncbi:unnamed protein product [Heligmosomoides polygyrus]|uniref:Helitron_like_N domain-containing protein n=1 Tax=Heligmosomoides polygyrus TaxID=6339 RepID=A0A183F7Z0_HELPZ|nr:unnamed protein product [Heligmosomoides polygyrus]
MSICAYMSTQLTSYKRLLTQYCNKLEAILARAQEDQSDQTQRKDNTRALSDEKEFYNTMQETLGAIDPYTAKIEQLWKEYSGALSNMANVPSKSDSEDFEQYSSKAEDNSPQTQRIDLPTIPIPTFTGNIWGWDNFWVLFNANAHTQPLPPPFKFNHLLSALKGEPRNAIMRFQVTDHNYQRAIDFPNAKYGNQEELDQRVLLDQLHVTVSQLRGKGEQVDSQWLQKQVLAKFPEQVQRRVLEKKYCMEGSFLMDNLLNTMDELISGEEQIVIFTSHIGTSSAQYPLKEKPSKAQFPRGADAFMYVVETTKRNHVQGKHHTSCCFKASTSPATSAPQGKPSIPARTKEKPKFT